MRKVLIAALGLTMVVGIAQANELNLWVTYESDTPGVPSDPGTPMAGDVLTLWASGTAGDKWLGINFDVLGTGEVNILNDELISGSGLTRWETASILTGTGEVGAIAVTTQGLTIGGPLDNIKVGDAYRLGTITAAGGDIMIQGTVGFARKDASEGEDTIIIAGNQSIASNDKTTLLYLTTPEPASLLLLSLGGLLIRRR